MNARTHPERTKACGGKRDWFPRADSRSPMRVPGEYKARTPMSRGVTMVELLLGLFIFAIAGTAILGSYLWTNYLAVDARETLMAINDLKDMMERIHATPFNRLYTDFPDGVPDGGGGNSYATIVGGYTLQNEQVVVDYPNPTASRAEFIITLNWTQRTRQRTVRASSLRTSS